MISKLLNDETGSASVGTIIIAVAIIVFLILPLTGMVFNQLKVQVVVNEVRQSIDTAVQESYQSLQVPFLSKEEFRADNGLLQSYVEEHLKGELKLKDDGTPNVGSILDGQFEINSLIFIDSLLLPFTDPDNGKIYNRPFVEIDFTVRMKPMLYQQSIEDSTGQEFKEIRAKRKVTLPINN